MIHTVTTADGERESDIRLVRRVRAGEAQAFEAIMRRHNRRLFRIAYSILGDAAEAEDAVQESYVRAFTSLDQLKDAGSFPTWLATIAVNEARGRRRRLQRFASLDGWAGPGPDRANAEATPMFTLPPSTPERLALAAELRCVLEAAIDALPGPFRTVFMLRAIEQLSVEETASCLGIPQATVKTRFHRARALLRQSLQAEATNLMPDLYPFDGARCDRVVEKVRARLGLG